MILASGEDLASTGISHGNSMIRIFGISWGPRDILRFLQGTIIIVLGTVLQSPVQSIQGKNLDFSRSAIPIPHPPNN